MAFKSNQVLTGEVSVGSAGFWGHPVNAKLTGPPTSSKILMEGVSSVTHDVVVVATHRITPLATSGTLTAVKRAL